MHSIVVLSLVTQLAKRKDPESESQHVPTTLRTNYGQEKVDPKKLELKN